MRIILLAILQVICLTSIGQRSDGFFIQEYCFVDLDLIKQLKVDKFEIIIYQNNTLSGRVEVFLDSNFLMTKKISYTNSIEVTEYASTTLSQFACPILRPDYIKECVLGRITKTESGGAFRITSFDLLGKVVQDKWKPGSELLEIRREFIYKNDLLDSIKLEDVRDDGSINKRELYIYNYNNEKLNFVKQLIMHEGSYQEEGEFKFKYFNSGLVKRMEGTGYSGRIKAKIEFKYYSKGQLL